jgi:putative intracellular protease/amidase
MSNALFVVTEEGYWGEECITPLHRLDSEGYDVTVATPTGEKPVLDDVSADPDEVGEEMAETVTEAHENDDRLNDPVPVAGEEADDYEVVVFPGGHGTLWDINQDRDARRLLRETVAGDDGTALVVCHAVGLLGFTRSEASADASNASGETASDEGEFLVDGRTVTGFPNEWEHEMLDDADRLPDGRKLPYFVADEVEAAGGVWNPELDADASVQVDGDLVTARGPESSEAGVETVLDEL